MRFTGEISGNIFIDGVMRHGTLEIQDEIRFSEETKTNAMKKGTLIPSLINAHTHIGDSFITDIPAGDIPDIVGPGGFKHRMLSSTDDSVIINGMERSMRIMQETGTTAFMDFRESGLRGLNLLERSLKYEVMPVALGRPDTKIADLGKIIDRSNGFAPSAISDEDFYRLMQMRKMSRERKKLFGIHFSENSVEDIEALIRLSPDFIVHSIASRDEDLDRIARANIPVVITPRSNIFYGKRPDYARFLDHGIQLMLGTDNGMVAVPDMMQEMSFLYTYQRGIGILSPEAIIRMSTELPYEFLTGHGIQPPRAYIFFPDVKLSPFEIVTRGRYFRHETIFV
ncbi:MAG: amidohydrolase family protein [Thermoplasmataceae archaeon]